MSIFQTDQLILARSVHFFPAQSWNQLLVSGCSCHKSQRSYKLGAEQNVYGMVGGHILLKTLLRYASFPG